MDRFVKAKGKLIALAVAGLMLGTSAFMQVTASAPSAQAAYCDYCIRCVGTHRGLASTNCSVCCIEP